jgi:hypothetical protein
MRSVWTRSSGKETKSIWDPDVSGSTKHPVIRCAASLFMSRRTRSFSFPKAPEFTWTPHG